MPVSLFPRCCENSNEQPFSAKGTRPNPNPPNPPHPLASPVKSPVRLPVSSSVPSGTLFWWVKGNRPKVSMWHLAPTTAAHVRGNLGHHLSRPPCSEVVLKVCQSFPRSQTTSIEMKSVCQGDGHPLGNTWSVFTCPYEDDLTATLQSASTI